MMERIESTGTATAFIAGLVTDGVSDERVDVLRELVDLYRSLDLLPKDRDAPLCRVCPNRRECWKNTRSPDNFRQAGISVPWIGRAYGRNRVLIVATNFNDWGGLDANWHECQENQHAFENRRPGLGGRSFADGAFRYANLAIASIRGRGLPADWRHPDRKDLAPLIDTVAFLQAVKCSPGSARSNPTEAMRQRCPPFLLKRELAILRPRVVLLLGRSTVRDPVRKMLQVEWGEAPGSMERDRFQLDGAPVELFSLNHPSRPTNAATSLAQMRDSLVATPLDTV